MAGVVGHQDCSDTAGMGSYQHVHGTDRRNLLLESRAAKSSISFRRVILAVFEEIFRHAGLAGKKVIPSGWLGTQDNGIPLLLDEYLRA